MNVLIAAFLVASLAEPVPAKRVDQVVVSNPDTTNVHVEVTCDYPVYQTVDDVSTNVFREALPDGTYVWKTNIWRTSKQIITGYTPMVQVASFSAAPGHSVFTNANSQLDIVEGMRVFVDAGPAKVTLAYALVAKADKTEGMTDNALVLTNGAVKTKSGTTITPGNIGAASASDLGGKLDTFHSYNEEQPDYGSSLRWLDGSAGLAFGYYTDISRFHPQIRISDTPYGEIRHVGHVNPNRPWSWITIGDSTDENTLQDALDAKADKAEGMTDNALVFTDDKVQTKGGDENLGEASLGTLHVSRIYNNDLRQGGPLYIASPWMYAFVDKFIIGGTDQNPDGAYNVTIEGSGIWAYNGGSYFGFPQGRSGTIALENWQSLSEMLRSTFSSDLAKDQTFSDAVLAVGLNIDTNSVAVLNEIAATFGGFPIKGTATTVGGLLAALAAVVAWLKKNKVDSFDSVGGAYATVDNGVAKLDDFFTESNSLLNGRLVYSRNETGLKDRAFNTLSFDGTEFNLSTALAAVTPTASGQPRDLLIVATATAATTISFTAGTIKGDKPTIDGAGTWLITLTEYAANTWYCRQIKMEDAA